jgi:guanylate kinase
MILAIMGRTASGKNAIGEKLKELYGYEEMVSYTTRPIRTGEKDGVDYHYLTMKECQKKLDNGEFLELVQYGGNYYGTGKKEIEEMCDPTKKCLFVCTPDGAEQIKKFAGEENVKCIYIEAPEEDRLKRYMNREGKGGWSNENMLKFKARTKDEDETFKAAKDIADLLVKNGDKFFEISVKDENGKFHFKVGEERQPVEASLNSVEMNEHICHICFFIEKYLEDLNKDICYLNRNKYEINKDLIMNYLDTWEHKFTPEEKESITDNICSRMKFIDVDVQKVQEFNFVEDAYADAACCYVFSHNNSVRALLDEKDDSKVFECMGMGKPGPEEEQEME